MDRSSEHHYDWSPPVVPELPQCAVDMEAPVPSEQIERSSVHVEAEDVRLNDDRMAVLDEVHSAIRAQWLNGGLIFRLYRYRHRAETSDLVEGDVIEALEQVAKSRGLPVELAGSSVAYLREGHIRAEPLERFADMVYSAVSSGGAYGNPLGRSDAELLTRAYVEALLDGSPAGALRCFALDPGFSSWFYQVAWDLGYVIVNTEEGWFGLFAATDTD